VDDQSSRGSSRPAGSRSRSGRGDLAHVDPDLAGRRVGAKRGVGAPSASPRPRRGPRARGAGVASTWGDPSARRARLANPFWASAGVGNRLQWAPSDRERTRGTRQTPRPDLSDLRAGRPIDDVARELGLDPAASSSSPQTRMRSGHRRWRWWPQEGGRGGPAVPEGAATPCASALRSSTASPPTVRDRQRVERGDRAPRARLHRAEGRGGHGHAEFVVYRLVAILFGAMPIEVPLVNFRNHLEGLAGAITKRTKVVVVSTPTTDRHRQHEEELLSFVRSLPDHVVCVVDEAYCDFADHAPDIRPLIREGRNIIGAADLFEGLRPGVAADRLRLLDRAAGVASGPGPPAVQCERDRASGGRGGARRPEVRSACACGKRGRA